MPRKAPKEVIEHRITLGDFERKQLTEFVDSYQKDKILENVPNLMLGTAALGIATANKLSNKSEDVVAVIGDGALSAGMAYEAMNNAGSSKTKMIVILNDNDMSISKPVGALRTYLAKILSGKIYFSLRETIKLIISSFSKRFMKKAGKAEDFFRSAVTGGTFFNSLGL